jgi:hypothetical protein
MAICSGIEAPSVASVVASAVASIGDGLSLTIIADIGALQ